MMKNKKRTVKAIKEKLSIIKKVIGFCKKYKIFKVMEFLFPSILEIMINIILKEFENL